MEAQEVKDFEVLINLFFPFAEELLRKFGEFHPFAGAINTKGEVVSVGKFEPSDFPASEETINMLKSELITGQEQLKVASVFYDVRTTDTKTGEKTDAIAVFVEHREGNAAYEFLYPYKLHGEGEITIAESFGNMLNKQIFTKE